MATKPNDVSPSYPAAYPVRDEAELIDDIASRTRRQPVNRTARMVAGHGNAFCPEHKYLSHAPYQTRAFPVGIDGRHGINFPTKDITGRIYGRLTVLGLHCKSAGAMNSKTNGALWVVLCQCGYYDLVRTKQVESGRRRMCGRCSAIEYVKHHYNNHLPHRRVVPALIEGN